MSAPSDAELLDRYRQQFAAASTGAEYTLIDGFTFKNWSPDVLWALIKELEQRIALTDTDTDNSGFAYIIF